MQDVHECKDGQRHSGPQPEYEKRVAYVVTVEIHGVACAGHDRAVRQPWRDLAEHAGEECDRH